jgi:AraC-like DNA-binding protein
MVNRFHIPRPPLSRYATSFWLYEGQPPQHQRERLLPTGTTELVINLRADALHVAGRREGEPLTRRRGAIVCGPHSEYFVIDAAEKASLLAVNFLPGGAFPFFGVPAAELHNKVVSLEALWGAEAGRLRERLLEVGTAERKFWLLERALLSRLSDTLADSRAVAFALRALAAPRPGRTVAAVSDELGYSARRLAQLFGEQVGLTPKRFQRVQRFQAVLRALERLPDPDWARIALACGYFDQAHFNHDFQAFSGLSPGAYLREAGPQLNHVPA